MHIHTYPCTTHIPPCNIPVNTGSKPPIKQGKTGDVQLHTPNTVFLPHLVPPYTDTHICHTTHIWHTCVHPPTPYITCTYHPYSIYHPPNTCHLHTYPIFHLYIEGVHTTYMEYWAYWVYRIPSKYTLLYRGISGVVHVHTCKYRVETPYKSPQNHYVH